MKLLSPLILLASTAFAFAGINPPTNLSATGIATNQISLTWTDTSSNEEGTYIERASSSTGPWTRIATASANATSYVNTGLSTATRYYYRARTFTRTRVTPYSAVASAITLSGGTAPTAPTSLTATAASSTQINLLWHTPTGTGVGGIASYKVYRSGVNIATVTAPTTNYNNTGLTLGTQYCYTVAAVDTAGNSSPQSSQACATTLGDTTRPTTPTGFTVNSASASQINLAWTASTDSGGSGLVGYKIYRGGVQIATTTATSYSNTGLAASTQYCYTVTAYDGAGNESFATPSLCATTGSVADTTPPSAPTGTLATTNSSTVITVTWNASTDTGGSGLAGYKIIRDSVQIATVAAGTTSYQNVGLTPNTIYCYAVAAYDGAGNTSANSAQSCATTPAGADTTAPSVPTGLVATAKTSTRIDLVWNASTDSGGSGLKGYKVYRGGVQINTTTATGYTNSGGLSPNTSYTYTVAAYDNSGNTSAQSAGSSATTFADTTAPSVPTGVIASSTQGNSNIVTWNASVDSGGSGISTYRIYTNSVLLTTSSSRTYTHTGLAASTQYCYTIAALDNAGNASAQSLQSCATTPSTADTTDPTVPASFTATTASSSQVNLAWTTSTDSGGSGLSGYKIYRGGVQVATTTSTSYFDTGLSPATLYCYTVAAYDNAGNTSAQSTQDCATTTSVVSSGQWEDDIGSVGDEKGRSIATAPNGDVIATGYYSGTLAVGGTTLTSAGGTDVFVVRYSSSGALIWVKSFGGTGNDQGNGVAVDSTGAVVLTGDFETTINFGLGVLTSAGASDIFVAKLTSAGVGVWAKRYGDSSNDVGYSITVDTSGNAYTTGFFQGSVNFGGSTLTSNISGVGALTTPDTFILKLASADGSYVWGKNIANNSQNQGKSIAMTPSGDIFLTGFFLGSVDILGSGTLTSAGVTDIYLARITGSAGTLVWAKRIGGTESEEGYAVVSDSNGDAILTGYFRRTVNFGGVDVTSIGADDLFIVKYSASSGAFLWQKTYGSTFADRGFSVAVDGNDNVIVTGAFQGSINFGGGALATYGSYDIFLAKYSSSGVFDWAEHYGGTSNDQGLGVTAGVTGNIATTGYFFGTGSFYGTSVSGAGGNDAFIIGHEP